jgi:hypothetical protein
VALKNVRERARRASNQLNETRAFSGELVDALFETARPEQRDLPLLVADQALLFK